MTTRENLNVSCVVGEYTVGRDANNCDGLLARKARKGEGGCLGASTTCVVSFMHGTPLGEDLERNEFYHIRGWEILYARIRFAVEPSWQTPSIYRGGWPYYSDAYAELDQNESFEQLRGADVASLCRR